MSQVKLKNVRLSFPNLWKAVEFKTGDGKPRYDATFLVEPGSDNDKAIKAAIRETAKETFGAKWEAILKSLEGNTNKMCYLDGNLKEYDGYEGMMYLACHAKARPYVCDKNPKVQLTEADGRPYAGCYVNATVEIYAQKGDKQGVRASFTGVQFAADGDAFSAGKPASADDFEELEEGAGSEML